MKKFLVIFPNTFLWFNQKNGLFYNSDIGSFLWFNMTPIIQEYCIKINDFNNLYVIPVSLVDLKDKNFSTWIKNVEEGNMGYLRSLQGKVDMMSIPPILNLQPEIEERKMDNLYFRSINIASNLHEVTFFLGGELLPKDETDYCRQFIYPISSICCLSPSEIESLLVNTNISYLQQINIVSGQVANYPYWATMFKMLKNYHISVRIFVTDINIDFFEKYKDVLSSTQFNLSIFYKNADKFKTTEKFLAKEHIQHQWLFLIRNIEEQEHVQKKIDENPWLEYDLHPVIEQNLLNISFLKKNLFTTYDDLLQTKIEKRKIFCNQTINSNFWGQILVSPDLKIFTNLNGKAWKFQNNVLNIIHEEIVDKNSFWRISRNKVHPCCDCVFCDLCPPPSNYELYLNRFDLCIINNDRVWKKK